MELSDVEHGAKVKVTMTVTIDHTDDRERPHFTTRATDEDGYTHYLNYDSDLDAEIIVNYVEGGIYEDSAGDVFVYRPYKDSDSPWLGLCGSAFVEGTRFSTAELDTPIARLVRESK